MTNLEILELLVSELKLMASEGFTWKSDGEKQQAIGKNAAYLKVLQLIKRLKGKEPAATE